MRPPLPPLRAAGGTVIRQPGPRPSAHPNSIKQKDRPWVPPLSRFRDLLPSRPGRSRTTAASGFIASELGRTCRPVQRTARARFGLASLDARPKPEALSAGSLLVPCIGDACTLLEVSQDALDLLES